MRSARVTIKEKFIYYKIFLASFLIFLSILSISSQALGSEVYMTLDLWGDLNMDDQYDEVIETQITLLNSDLQKESAFYIDNPSEGFSFNAPNGIYYILVGVTVLYGEWDLSQDMVKLQYFIDPSTQTLIAPNEIYYEYPYTYLTQDTIDLGWYGHDFTNDATIIFGQIDMPMSISNFDFYVGAFNESNEIGTYGFVKVSDSYDQDTPVQYGLIIQKGCYESAYMKIARYADGFYDFDTVVDYTVYLADYGEGWTYAASYYDSTYNMCAFDNYLEIQGTIPPATTVDFSVQAANDDWVIYLDREGGYTWLVPYYLYTGMDVYLSFIIAANDTYYLAVENYNNDLFYLALDGENYTWTDSWNGTFFFIADPYGVNLGSITMPETSTIEGEGPSISAMFAWPQDGTPPLEVYFSVDIEYGDFPIKSIIWDFGDGSQDEGDMTSHIFYDSGNYWVTAIVTDTNGLQAEQTVLIQVSEDSGLAPDIMTISADSTTLYIEDTTQITILLNRPALNDITINLRSSNSSVISVPSSVNISTGENHVTFSAQAGTKTGGSVIYASSSGFPNITLPINVIGSGGQGLLLSPTSVEIVSGETKDFKVTGGTAPYNWSVSDGEVVPSTGEEVTYQAPQASGTYTILVQDSAGSQTEATVQVYRALNISPLVSNVLPSSSLTFSIDGGKKPYVISISSGQISEQTSTETGSTFTYTAPSETGQITVTVTDSMGRSVSSQVRISLRDSLIVTPAEATLAPGETLVLNGSGGTPPYEWSAESGFLSTTSGTQTTYIAPDETGTYEITIKDRRGGWTTVKIRVSSGNIAISPTLVTAFIGQEEDISLYVTGGLTPYEWSTTQGSVTPDETGEKATYHPGSTTGEVTISVKDSAGNIAHALVRIVSIVYVTPAKVNIGQGDTKTFKAINGQAPYTWKVEQGTLSSTQGSSITYIAPQIIGNYTLEVQDSLGFNAQAEIVVNGSLMVTPVKQVITLGETARFTVSRGVAPYTWPDSSQGNTYTANIQEKGEHEIVVSDSQGNSAIAVVQVVGGQINITPSQITMKPGETKTLKVSGGAPEYDWSVTLGGLSVLKGSTNVFIAPDLIGESIVTVEDSLGNIGKTQITIVPWMMDLSNASYETTVLKQNIKVNGISTNSDEVLIGPSDYVDISVTLELANNITADAYLAGIFKDRAGNQMLLFKSSELATAFGTDMVPYYTGANGTIELDFWHGALPVDGRLEIYVGYQITGGSLIINQTPFVVDISN